MQSVLKFNLNFSNVPDYKWILDQVNELIIFVDQDHIIRYTNHQITNLLGYPVDGIIGQPVKQILSNPEEWFQEKVTVNKTISFITGERKSMQLDCQVTPHQDGLMIAGTSLSTEAITEVEQERKFFDLYKDAPIGIFRTLTSGEILNLNEAMSRMLGFHSSKEAIHYYQHRIDRMYHNPERRKEFIRLLKDNGSVSHFDFKAIINDGSSRWFSVSATQYPYKEPDISLIEGFMVEISHRKRTENIILREGSRLKSVIQSIPVMCFALNDQAKVIFWNNECENVTGYTYSEASKFPDLWDALMHEQLEKERVRKFFDEPTNFYNEIIAINHKNKKKRFLMLSSIAAARPVQDWHSWGIGYDVTTRKLQEDQLNFQSSVLTHIRDSVIATDTDGKITYINQAAIDLFGYEESEMLGNTLKHLYFDEDRHLYRDHLSKALKKDNIHNKELKLRHKSGKAIWIDVQTNPIFDNKKHLKGVVGVSRDITEHRLIMKGREEEEALRLGILSAIPDLLMIIDRNGVINYLHAPNKPDLLHPADQLLGKSMQDMLDPATAAIVKDKIIQALDQEKVLVETYSMQMQEGLQHFEARISAAGKYGAVVLIRNITVDKSREARIVESEKKFRSVIDQSLDGIIIINEHGILIEWNNGARLQTGLSKEQVIGKNFTDILLRIQKDAENSLLYKILVRFKQENDPQLNFIDDVVIINQKDHSEKYLQYLVFPIHLENKLNVCAIARDLTDEMLYQLKIEEQNSELQELNSTKDKFFSIIAHDLKTPFNQMQGLTEILLQSFEKGDPEETRMILHMVRQSVVQGNNLLQNLLEWSRSQTGRIKFAPEPLLLSEITGKVHSFLAHSLSSKNIYYKENLPKNIKVWADRNMVETVLRNLVGNAIKFTSRGGKVEVIASTNITHATIEVKDNGRGMSKEEQGKLFRIDINYSVAGTENEKGTGLGLILCRDFVQKNHGEIWVKSKPGAGSSFYFTLPLSQ